MVVANSSAASSPGSWAPRVMQGVMQDVAGNIGSCGMSLATVGAGLTVTRPVQCRGHVKPCWAVVLHVQKRQRQYLRGLLEAMGAELEEEEVEDEQAPAAGPSQAHARVQPGDMGPAAAVRTEIKIEETDMDMDIEDGEAPGRGRGRGEPEAAQPLASGSGRSRYVMAYHPACASLLKTPCNQCLAVDTL